MTYMQALLGLVAEECAEIAQRASKAQRFGINEIQPGQENTNAHRVLAELADLKAVFEMLNETDFGSFPPLYERQLIDAKKQKAQKFIQYSRDLGQIEPEEVRTLNISELAIPNWHEASQGLRGPRNGEEPCVICGRGVTTYGAKTTYWVWMDARNGNLIPFGSDGPGHAETGLQPIGQNCYKRHAETLRGLVKRITQSESRRGGTVDVKEEIL